MRPDGGRSGRKQTPSHANRSCDRFAPGGAGGQSASAGDPEVAAGASVLPFAALDDYPAFGPRPRLTSTASISGKMPGSSMVEGMRTSVPSAI